MRRAIGLLLALGALVVSTEAVSREPNRFGVTGGVNLSRMGSGMDAIGDALVLEYEDVMTGDWTYEIPRQTGPVLGLYFAFPVTPQFAIQLEGLYVRRGSKLEFHGQNLSPDFPNGPEEDLTMTFKLDYVELSALARFEPWPDSRFRPYLLAGPAFGIKAKANLDQGPGEDASISDLTKSEAFGLIGGLGFVLVPGKTSQLVIQGRYFQGLTDLLIGVPDTEAGDFSIMAAVEFTLKSKQETQDKTLPEAEGLDSTPH